MRFRYFIIATLIVIAHLAAGVYYNGYPLWWIGCTLMAFLGITILACIKIQWNFFLTSVNRIPLSFKQLSEGTTPVALTFDDGPHELTESVLDILKAEQVKATFFLIGKNIAGREAILQRMKDEGHLIGNHSYEHSVHFDWQSTKKMALELQACNEAIQSVTGFTPTIFRPPFGVTNPNLAKAVTQLNMQSIGWNVRSMDTVAKDASILKKKILSKTRANSIILLHDRCAVTVELLPELIRALKEKGYSFTFPSGTEIR
ncbi:polysaccharide deacetylase family protein [Taibaiella sp. KBW10]|uniref:polysaccharide deacetylase family protein n=1 Tax=Taibaiella sp. KBW10 TaxID=2153357 RepID=UPI000F5B4F72|nr:polysaccharide deacetylase family protein [Taibaiella sp. KBW10]RQO29782.1 polysaccharide deacetylase family protein [Taibaiella sp. KBW10]